MKRLLLLMLSLLLVLALVGTFVITTGATGQGERPRIRL